MESIVRKNNLVPRLSLNKILMRQGSVISQEEKKITSVKCLTVCTSLVASLGYVAIGTFIAWSSKLSANIGGEEKFWIDIQEISWLSSVIALVAAVITILVYKVYFMIGTKKTVLLAAVLMISSLVVSLACDVNFQNTLISRLLAGCGVGIMYLLIPVYLHELASTEYKLMAENVLNVAFAVGILFQYITDCLDQPSSVHFVFPFIFPVFFVVGFACLPESPKYLYVNNHILKAREILERYRESEDDTDCEFDRWTVNVERKERLGDLFRGIDNAKVMVPIIGLVVLQQLIGVIAVFFYMDKIFMLTNTHSISIKPSIIIALVFVAAIPLYEFFSIKVKHRTNLLWTTVTKALILAGLGWYCHVDNIRGMANSPIHEPSYAPVVCYGIVVLLYAIGPYRLTSRYIAVLSTDTNYFGIKTIATALGWFVLFGLVKCLPSVMNDIGAGWVFWTMFVMLMLTWLFVYYFVPELPASQMGDMLASCSTSEGGGETSPSLSADVEFV